MDHTATRPAEANRGDGAGHPASATDEAKARAGELWDDAKQAARSKLEEQKDAAAAGLGDVAGAFRDAARRRDDSGDRDTYAALSGSVADGLERLSQTLRSKDLSTMVRDTEAFARSQQVAFFGLALAAGFLGARFLKAAHPRPATDTETP
jgi:hypothetical protein